MRYVVLITGLSLLLFLVDLYVYRNWARFARYRRWALRYTLPPYRVLMAVMPFTLPLYLYVSQWWAVEPKLLRSAFVGFWFLYYVPKLPIALGILVKDAIRFVTWLFGWFQKRLGAQPQATPAALEVPTPAPPPRPSLDLTDMKRMSRGEFLRQMGWSAASVPFVVVGYGVFRTLYNFQIHRVDVPIQGLPRALDGLTIAQLSDLHAGSFFSDRPVQEAVSLVNAQRPDLVAITGDYVNYDAGELSVLLPRLAGLQAGLGIFGCLGNHDHYARVSDVAARVRAGPSVDLLVTQRRTLQIDGAHLHVIGTDNTGFNQHFADLGGALRGIEHVEGEEVRLLLAHDPTFWDHHVRRTHPEVDLMLAGHTHGGQIGFEWGPLGWSPAKMAYERWAGLYTEARPEAPQSGHHHLYVNRGLGTVGPPLRIGIYPEITILTLRHA